MVKRRHCRALVLALYTRAALGHDQATHAGTRQCHEPVLVICGVAGGHLSTPHSSKAKNKPEREGSEAPLGLLPAEGPF